MKYALLLNNAAADVERWETLSPEEAEAARAEEVPKWEAFFARVGERGQLVTGVELDGPWAAKTVRLVEGESLVTDGPYAETKEVVGGLLVVECENLDEAIELAASVPVADRGSVEIRPLAG
ncbi:MAG: transcription initiation protein [Thermoleophilia bacterium]|nr:transcription initiation protein [Thermoleophilia bacterium]